MSNPDQDVDDPEEDVIDLEDETDAEQDEVPPPANVSSSGRRFSGIYLHFNDSRDPKYAICKHCKKKVSCF